MAREADPADYQVARVLGILLHQRSEFLNAVRLPSECRAARPADAETLGYLGLAHVELKQPEQAKARLTEALQKELPPALAEACRKALLRL